jgi:hypothetical protein
MKNLFKSLFYSVVLGLAVMVSFTSCNKDEDDSAASKALLMEKTWDVTAIKSEKENVAFDALMKGTEIEIVFGKLNVCTIDFGMMGASMTLPGTWGLSGDGKSFTLNGETGTIEKLTATEFEVSFSQEDFQSVFFTEIGELETGRVTMVMKVK